MTPPTKVTDDPFIGDDRKPPSKSVPLRDKKINEQTLIPVTMKMINSAVSEDNQFVLKDGRPLHLVKDVGAVVHYHEYWNNDVIGIEDGTGKIRVVEKKEMHPAIVEGQTLIAVIVTPSSSPPPTTTRRCRGERRKDHRCQIAATTIAHHHSWQHSERFLSPPLFAYTAATNATIALKLPPLMPSRR